MADWMAGLKALGGVLGTSGNAGGKTQANDGSSKAKRQQEYEAATSNMQNVYKSTNDKGERDKAHQRFMAAAAALQ